MDHTHPTLSHDPYERAFRLAVLLANNDESDFSKQFPNDAEKACSLLKGRRPEWVYDIYSVKDGVFPDVGSADGFIITGSPASVHDKLPWIVQLEDLIREFNEQRVPLVGLCFGHQIIAKALGGRVSHNPGGWRFGVAETDYAKFTSWMEPPISPVRLHACHSEQVSILPPGALLLGGDSFCPIASFALGDHIFTTEYHPEFNQAFMISLADAYRGEMPDEVLDAGREQLRGALHAELFARWMAQFFERRRN